MDKENIDKSLVLAKFLVNNIVQIRGLCHRVFLEAKENECIETFNRVMCYVDASFKKTSIDVETVNVLLKSVELGLHNLCCEDKDLCQLSFNEIKALIDSQLKDSVFVYKED